MRFRDGLVAEADEPVPGNSARRRGRVRQEFQAVAPGVFGEEAAGVWEGVVVGDLNAGSKQSVAQLVEILGDKRGVGFLGGAEVALDADVQLLGAALKPAASARAERRWLFDFREAEERAVEFAGGGLASLGSGNLNVVQARDV